MPAAMCINPCRWRVGRGHGFRPCGYSYIRRSLTGSRGDTVLGNSRSDSVGQSIIVRHRGRRCLTAHWFSPFSVAVVNFGPDFIQGEH